MSAAPTVPRTSPTMPEQPGRFEPGGTVASALVSPKGLRLLGTWVLLGLVLAVMTGKDGSADKPLDAIVQDIFAPRIVIFLIIAVVMWVAAAATATLCKLIILPITPPEELAAAMRA